MNISKCATRPLIHPPQFPTRADKGDDDTDGLIRSIQSEKLKIVYSTWDMSLRQGGRVYALETDKVIQQVSADTDWIFYKI